MEIIKDNAKGIVKNFLNKDNDYLTAIVGREGSGKSTLGIEWCSEADPNFNPSRICFNGVQFLKAVMKAKPKEAILWDEAGDGGYSRDSMKTINNLINKVLMFSRAKQLFIVVIIPNFFMLEKYLRISRLGLLLYVTKRGSVDIFTNKKRGRMSASSIIQLSIKGQKYYNMDCVNSDSSDTFPILHNYNDLWSEDGVYYKEYTFNKHKFINDFIEKSIKELEGDTTKKETRDQKLGKLWGSRFKALLDHYTECTGNTKQSIAVLLNIPKDTIQSLYR